ncbi:diguanylate cyclase [Gallaecimonas pentaromativorans]|uniref:sensor domain-containing diguanylate cyclase n=1 Tax=Gallaecimonas pentaromativorans TaxID=584787 RepID=UPI003A940243
MPHDQRNVIASDPPLGTTVAANALLLRFPWLSDLLLILLWMASWRIASLMEYAPHASIWFPPSGVTFAAFLLLGKRALPAIVFCGLASTFWEDMLDQSQHSLSELLQSGLLFGVVHSLSYWLGAAITLLVIRRSSRHNLPTVILAFLLLGPLSALLATFTGTQALAVTSILSGSDISQIWLAWWIGDLIGIIALTPLCIGLISRFYPRCGSWILELGLRQSGSDRYGFVMKLLLSALLLTLTMTATAQFHHDEVAFSIFFMCIPLMWIVHTETPLRSALSLALLSTLTAVGIKMLALSDHALVYQFAISVLAASTYFGLTVPVLVSHNARLRQIALEDGLTKAASRSHFFEQAEQEVLRARHYRQPISLVVFDIDHFKSINDKYGHSVGDMALVAVASTVKRQLRQADILGRFGGDEFMMLLPGDTLSQARETADRMRLALMQLTVQGPIQGLAGSFGVVEVMETETIMEAFDRADRHLLEAKRAGRNQVAISA